MRLKSLILFLIFSFLFSNTFNSYAMMHHPDDPAKMAEHMALLNLVSEDTMTHKAVKNGSWFEASTWSPAEVPDDNARVLIPENLTVSFSGTSTKRIKYIRVNGSLIFDANSDSLLYVDTIVGDTTSYLEIGTKAAPVTSSVKIVFLDNGALDRNIDPQQLSRGMVVHGKTSIVGQAKDSHMKIARDAFAGDTELLLSKIPMNWKVGDEIILGSTHYKRMRWGDKSPYVTEDEIRTISSISGNTIGLDKPLDFDHDSPRADLKAYVANASRNIIFENENQNVPNNQRAHTMFMHSHKVDLRYASFIGLGRSDKSYPFDDFKLDENGKRIFTGPSYRPTYYKEDPLLIDNMRGRYPVHFHRVGVMHQDEPAIAVGNVVLGSPGWGIIHHDSHAIIEHNLVYDSYGAGIVAETGNETGIWRKNIVIKSGGRSGIAKHTANFDVGFQGVGYWYQGRLVSNEENVAISQKSHGIVYMHRGSDNLPVYSAHSDIPEVFKGKEMAPTDKPPIHNFHDNEVIASGRALEIIKASMKQGHDHRSMLDGLIAWEVDSGALLQYTAHYTLKDFDLIRSKSSYQDGWG
ncbi:MAG: hypothetical protein HRT47_09145 [Candidatus Caenarcaniphilales bacterium]|nr:hypothetical protein [Candidatus Caenarcaniphilales bacterium]